jgi:hypothetical protein
MKYYYLGTDDGIELGIEVGRVGKEVGIDVVSLSSSFEPYDNEIFNITKNNT